MNYTTLRINGKLTEVICSRHTDALGSVRVDRNAEMWHAVDYVRLLRREGERGFSSSTVDVLPNTSR